MWFTSLNNLKYVRPIRVYFFGPYEISTRKVNMEDKFEVFVLMKNAS